MDEQKLSAPEESLIAPGWNPTVVVWLLLLGLPGMLLFLVLEKFQGA